MQIKLYKSPLEFLIIFCDEVIVHADASTAGLEEKTTGFVIVDKSKNNGTTTHSKVPFVDGYFIYRGEKYVHFECEPEPELGAYNDDYYEDYYEDYYDDDYLTCP